MFAQSQNQHVILSGSEVLRTKQSEESKTCACAGIYEGVLRNLFSTRNVLCLCKKLLIKRKSQKLVYRFLRMLHTLGFACFALLRSQNFAYVNPQNSHTRFGEPLALRMTYRRDVRANKVTDKSKLENRRPMTAPTNWCKQGALNWDLSGS